PLPNYSSFAATLPAGTYWRWADRLATAPELVVLTEPALTDAVAGYLAVKDDAEALADFLVRAVVGSNARVRDDALLDIGRRREIPPLLDAGRLQPVDAWLHDESRPPLERARAIVQLARGRAAGIVPIAESLTGAPGPLQAPAIDALITVGHPPSVERLLVLNRNRDEPLRLVASRGLASEASPAALDRLAEQLSQEPSPSVRVAIMEAFGRAPNPRIVALASAELARSDKTVAGAAAEALVRQGTPEAVTALRKTLEEGQGDARTAAAFALKRMNRAETDAILEDVEKTHPDPEVRRLCRLALGESMHEH
ncbi:MAG: HEAT repeat domain-containing protein, partial [Candidatus Binatia bacterium]